MPRERHRPIKDQRKPKVYAPGQSSAWRQITAIKRNKRKHKNNQQILGKKENQISKATTLLDSSIIFLNNSNKNHKVYKEMRNMACSKVKNTFISQQNCLRKRPTGGPTIKTLKQLP